MVPFIGWSVSHPSLKNPGGLQIFTITAGRGVDSSIDAILIAVEPSYESMAIARRIKEISSGMRKPFWAVLNKVKSNAVATKLKTDLKKSSIEVIGVIPDDPLIFEASFEGRPFMAGAATRAARGILDFLLSLE